MKKKIIGIFLCMLLITSAFPIVSSIDKYFEKDEDERHMIDKNLIEEDCGCGPNSDNKERSFGRTRYYKPVDQKDASPKPTIMEDLPDYFSWKDYQEKDWTTSAKNQLWPYPCGSCWAHAALATLESVINIRENKADLDVDLSEQYLLSCLSRAGNCQGGYLYKAFFYIMSNKSSGNNYNGIIPESCFQYRAIDAEGRDFFGYNHDPVLCDEKCEDWEKYLIPISDFGRWYPNGSSEDRDAIKTQVMQDGPVATAMMVTYHIHGKDNFWDWGYEHQDPDEYYSSSEKFEYTNHGITIVGWKDDASIDNGGYWICTNSWGPEWGYNGFFNIEYGCLNIDSFEIDWVDYNPEVFVNWEPVANAGENINGDIGEELIFDGSDSFDHEGEIISHEWDFGDGNNSSGETTTHSYKSNGIYQVTLTVVDNEGNTGVDAIWAFIEKSNNPPNTPTINGSLEGKKGTEYEYKFSAIDPNDDDLYYFIYWGDINYDSWIGPFPSGEEITLNHTFIDEAFYTLRVKAKDCYNSESDWATLEVTMPKNKAFNFNLNLLSWLFKRFPNAFPILKQILGLTGG